MDVFNVIPDLAKLLGIPQGTLLLLIFVAVIVSRAITRAIPDDATGMLAVIRNLTAIIAVEVSPRITSGVTVKDVAKQALLTPPITEKVERATGEPVSLDDASPAPSVPSVR